MAYSGAVLVFFFFLPIAALTQGQLLLGAALVAIELLF